jgi:hypothetical protein
MSLTEEAPKGRLAGLVALRERLAREIDTAEQSRDVAALSRQFSDVLLQIDELSAGAAAGPQTGKDMLEQKRKERAKRSG